MNKNSKLGKLEGASILSSVVASLCCITPVLALIFGVSGIASTFSWLEPARPYLLGIAIVVLGLAWYQKLKPRIAKEIQCDCEEEEKLPFIQTKLFLAIVTVFALMMMAFPYYSKIFYTNDEKGVVLVNKSKTETVNFNIKGMTCVTCEEHVRHTVNKLNGIISIDVSYKKSVVSVVFDNTKTSKAAIENSINTTGYVVIH